MWYKFDT
jgi:hypothetical protein